MRNTAGLAAMAMPLAAMTAAASIMPAAAATADAGTLELGKEVALDRQKGNCLACQTMGNGVAPGDIGPPLIAKRARFPDRGQLRAQIRDAQAVNPNTRMPPFGKYKVLSENEIDAAVDNIYTL
jgi:sulfur-oxidizing protein SoxX